MNETHTTAIRVAPDRYVIIEVSVRTVNSDLKMSIYTDLHHYLMDSGGRIEITEAEAAHIVQAAGATEADIVQPVMRDMQPEPWYGSL